MDISAKPDECLQIQSLPLAHAVVGKCPLAIVSVVSLAAVFWAVTQRSPQKKRLLTSELHSFLIVLAVCLRSFEQTNHVKMGLTDLRDSRCVSVVLIKAFLVLRLQAFL